MERAGFRCLAAIDFNAEAVTTLRANFPHLGEERARKEGLTTFGPERLTEIIGTGQVDVIVGGPPCQGFSTARQADGANHGERLKADPRRQLFRELSRHVDFFQSRVFVMENEFGIRTAAGGEHLQRCSTRREGRDRRRVASATGFLDRWKMLTSLVFLRSVSGSSLSAFAATFLAIFRPIYVRRSARGPAGIWARLSVICPQFLRTLLLRKNPPLANRTAFLDNPIASGDG